VSIVILSAPEHLPAVRKRLSHDDSVAVFADTDSLKALEAIQHGRPQIVALNPTFAKTARGAALVAELKADSRLHGIGLRVLIEDEDKAPLLLSDTATSAEKALLATSRPLDHAGTRAAVRYVMGRRDIVVNGEPSSLIDLSVTGAQVVVSKRVRPEEPVRIVLSHEGSDARFPGTIVWSVAVPISGSIHYRAGVKLAKPDTQWLERYCHQFGGRPDLTFGSAE
jgi:hypothetical protein